MAEVTPSKKIGSVQSISSRMPEMADVAVELSIVIPVFNERENLQPLYERLKEALKPLGTNSEILFINDGSTDGSSQILSDLARIDSTIRILEFVRNFGQTAAISAGFDHAEGEIIIPLDADLQNDPHDISRIMEKLEEGYEVVSLSLIHI